MPKNDHKKMPKNHLEKMRAALAKQRMGQQSISIFTKTPKERQAAVEALEAEAAAARQAEVAAREAKAAARRQAEAAARRQAAIVIEEDLPQGFIQEDLTQGVIEEPLIKEYSAKGVIEEPLGSFEPLIHFKGNDPLANDPLAVVPVYFQPGRKQIVFPYQGKRYKKINQSKILENLEKRIKETSGGATHRRRQNNNKTAKQRKLFKKRSTRRRQIHKRNRSH